MNTPHPSRVLAGASLLALLLGFLRPLPALAEDEAPPTTAPATEIALQGETAPADPGSMPVPFEGDAPAEAELSEAALPDAPTEELSSPVEEPALPELIEQVPDGTTIAIVDAEGELVPLAADAAVALVA